nr:MAG TPA: hypothetical protein [Caudoviricetes sp.]
MVLIHFVTRLRSGIASQTITTCSSPLIPVKVVPRNATQALNTCQQSTLNALFCHNCFMI